MIYIFHPEAREELEDAAAFYCAQRAGLERKFIKRIYDCAEQAVLFPLASPIIDADARGIQCRAFPYRVIYCIEPSCIFILAVMHSKREPGYWKHRLPKS